MKAGLRGSRVLKGGGRSPGAAALGKRINSALKQNKTKAAESFKGSLIQMPCLHGNISPLMFAQNC